MFKVTFDKRQRGYVVTFDGGAREAVPRDVLESVGLPSDVATDFALRFVETWARGRQAGGATLARSSESRRRKATRSGALIRNADGSFAIRYYEWGVKDSPRRYENLGTDYDRAKVRAAAIREEVSRRQVEAKRWGSWQVAKSKSREFSSDITFAELARQFIEGHGPAMAPKSRERLEQVTRLYLLPCFGHMRAEDLTIDHVNRYAAARLSSAKAPSDGTVRREWTFLRSILRWGDENDLIENPIRPGHMKSLCRELKAKDKAREVYFTPDEWRRFVRAFDDFDTWAKMIEDRRKLGPVRIGRGSESPRRYGGGFLPRSETGRKRFADLARFVPIFRALFLTAARINELLSLRWSDVNLDEGVLRIAQSKTGNAKRLPIVAGLREVFDSLERGVGDALVFRKTDGRPYLDRDVQRAFREAAAVAGIEKNVTPHATRHTVKTWLDMMLLDSFGGPILGHVDDTITAGYSHATIERLRPVLQRLEAVANGAPLEPVIVGGSEAESGPPKRVGRHLGASGGQKKSPRNEG